LQLDEVVLDDLAEVRLNDRPTDSASEARPLSVLSPGQRCSAILPILLLSGTDPLVIDQPEENLDNRLIRQVVVNILASMKLHRQVIIATHNPNLPVLGDVEQCVVLQATGRDLSTVVASGSLDAADVSRYVTEIMEGGREAFQYRQAIYQSHWDGPIDDAE
jgi:ABC-type Mn2+/Zn2+ transport system ATPase subunit